MKQSTAWVLGGTALLLAACGGSDSSDTQYDNSGARGSLVMNPPLQVAALDAAQFQARLSPSLLQLAGTPQCGVDFRTIEYGTVGGAGEQTNATGALMVPTGSAPGCSGPRPVVLYAHGTSEEKTYNISNITDPSRPGATEGLLLGAMYAAQGFIVVAPNYAGYDASRLGYHPYLNADQSAKEMVDALSAARKALPRIGASQDSGQLLLTGYSQGGHVTMATQRALQAAGQKVTAAAPMSGPYALSAMGDQMFFGNVSLAATLFVPMLMTSYQKAYGNLYRQPSEVYTAPYAAKMESLLPGTGSFETLIAQGTLPQALFSSTAPAPEFAAITPPTEPADMAPLFALGFGSNHLLNNATRLAYLQDALANPDGAHYTGGNVMPPANPQNPLRQALQRNDLRGWQPQRPTLLCAGSADPTVPYRPNTRLMEQLWSIPSPHALPPGVLTVLDVDSAPSGPNDPFAAAKAGFAQAKAQAAQAGGASAVLRVYHRELVPPFCNAAARGFFRQVLASGG